MSFDLAVSSLKVDFMGADVLLYKHTFMALAGLLSLLEHHPMLLIREYLLIWRDVPDALSENNQIQNHVYTVFPFCTSSLKNVKRFVKHAVFNYMCFI